MGSVLAAGLLGEWSPVFTNMASVEGATGQERIALDASADMVEQSGSFGYLRGRFADTSFQAALLPLHDTALSVLIVLPDLHRDLRSFVAAISTDRLLGWTRDLNATAGSIALPRFVRTHGDWLNAAVKSLGAPVSSKASANGFSMIVDRPFFYAVWDAREHDFRFVGVLTDPHYSATLALSADFKGAASP